MWVYSVSSDRLVITNYCKGRIKDRICQYCRRGLQIPLHEQERLSGATRHAIYLEESGSTDMGDQGWYGANENGVANLGRRSHSRRTISRRKDDLPLLYHQGI